MAREEFLKWLLECGGSAPIYRRIKTEILNGRAKVARQATTGEIVVADEHRDQDDQTLEKKAQENPTEQDQVISENDQQSAAGEAAQPEAEGGEARDLEAEVAALQAQLEHAHEQVLRSQAEVQNAMRRADRDIEKAHKFGQEKLVRDLLTVVDNLERALEAASAVSDESAKAITEGVELTLKSLLDVLEKNSVEAIDPQGEPFNPELHEAMSMVENGEVEPNTVLVVYQKGYLLNERLVRPARVVVSKAPVEA